MSIKDLPPPNSSMFLDRVREAVQSLLGRGDPNDKAVTVTDLVDAGLVSPGMGDPTPDLTPPPPPTGFTATAGTTRILFKVDTPSYRVGHGPARTIIYAANWDGVSPLPTFSDAVEFYNFLGPISSAPFDPASNLRLWARAKSVDGALSTPAGGVNGISVTMGLVDNLMIANISADKILAGSLDVGQYIQSADYLANTTGWRLQTLAGGSAFMEVNGGAIIGGAQIGADYIQSTNYILDTQGWRLKANGTGQIGGFRIASNYIESTNYVAGTSGFRLTYDGQILTKNFTVNAAGNATFSGSLSAASGTFAGSLSAATGTFAGSLSAATGTFAGSLSAATGTFAGALSAASGTFSGSLTAQVVNTANIVGAAITTVSSDTSSTTTAVTVSVSSGDRSLVVIGNVGSASQTIDATTYYASNSGFLTLDTGGGPVSVASNLGTVMYAISDPAAGTYAFSCSRTVQTGYVALDDSVLVVLLTRR